MNSVVYKGCLKKARYGQKKLAKQAKKACKTKYGCTYSIYKCQYCNGYHLTTKPQENQDGTR